MENRTSSSRRPTEENRRSLDDGSRIRFYQMWIYIVGHIIIYTGGSLPSVSTEFFADFRNHVLRSSHAMIVDYTFANPPCDPDLHPPGATVFNAPTHRRSNGGFVEPLPHFPGFRQNVWRTRKTCLSPNWTLVTLSHSGCLHQPWSSSSTPKLQKSPC
jgi:hypothetical protein